MRGWKGFLGIMLASVVCTGSTSAGHRFWDGVCLSYPRMAKIMEIEGRIGDAGMEDADVRVLPIDLRGPNVRMMLPPDAVVYGSLDHV